MKNDRPTKRPYFRIELERRFLLERLPETVDTAQYEALDDLYIEGAHVRLRVVREPNGAWLVTKLGQKIPDPDAPNDVRRRRMTTIYLPESEGAVFDRLPGLRTRKRRYRLVEQSWTFCIDVWEQPMSGVLVAEVETPSLEELERITMPAWALREVTDDSRYSAFSLALGTR